MKKRLLSLFLAVWMIVGMIPAQAFAADAEGNTLYVGDEVGQYATLEAAHTAAEDGDTITLCKDIKLSTTLNISKKVTIDLGEYNITSFGNVFKVAENGELLIKGSGTISGNHVITVDGGKVTVESGNISANTYGMMVWSGNVTILGGTIHGGHTGIYYSSGNHGIYGGTVSGGTYGVNVAGGKCEITGGRFSHDPSQYVDKSAYSVTEQDGWFVVSSTGGTEPTPPASDYVAMVGEQGYETLQDAVNAAQSGDTIELLKDVELTAIVTVPAGKNITLDLGGKTIESIGYDVGDEFTYAVLKVCGELTITDSGVGGKICCNAVADLSASYSVYVDDGTLNIEGGTISGHKDVGDIYGVYVFDGTVNISGGKIEATGNTDHAVATGVYVLDGTLNIEDGTIKATGYTSYGVDGEYRTADKVNISGGKIEATGYGVYNKRTVNIEGTANIKGGYGSVLNRKTANIKGGTFSGKIQNEGNGVIAISGGKFDKDPSQYVDSDKYQVTTENNWYFVEEKAQPVYVAMIGEQGYETLQAAYEAVNETNNTITLLKDVDLGDNYLDIRKKVTIDLDGYKISGEGIVFNIYSGGELSISGGTISADIGAILWNGNLTAADMNISAETGGIYLASDNVIANIESGNISGGIYGVEVAGGTANITGGTVWGGTYGVNVSYNGIVNISGNANISGSYGVHINGDYDPEANITGGTVSGTVNGVYVQSGNATITGGTVSGNNGLSVEANGTATIAGGTVTGGISGAVVYGELEITGGTVTGDTQGVFSRGTVTISGGTVSGEADGVFVLGSGIVDITGGRFSHDPSDFVPNTHQVTETEGWYVVSEKPQAEYVAEVGTQGYESLQAAYEAVNDTNNTITLLKDIDLGSNYIQIDKSLTLDLNGHKIESTSYALKIVSGGELTITDSGVGGTVSGAYYGIIAQYSGKVNIESGTVSGGYGVYAYMGGNVNISGGTVSGSDYGVGVYVYDGLVTITGGSVSGSDRGVHVDDGKCEISGGNISGVYYGVYVNNGTLSISDNANISGSYGVYVDGDHDPEANISGGNISGVYYGVYVQKGTANISGGTVSGVYCVYVYNGTANITGGTVSGDYCVFVYDGTCVVTGGTIEATSVDGVVIATMSGGKAEVTGGRFSHDPSQFVPDTHGVTEQDGWFVVSEKPQAEYVAQVGEQGFETLQDAYAAVNDTNNTITLLKDIDLGSAFLEVNKKLTLDLNGKDITGDMYAVKVLSGGELTITDSGEGGTVLGSTYGVWVVGGELSITGGTIKSTVANGSGVGVDGGVVNILGGTVSGDCGVIVQSGECEISGSAEVLGGLYGVFVLGGECEISGGTVSTSGAYGYGVKVIGGTCVVTGGKFNTDPSQFVPDTHGVTTEDGWYVVSKVTKYNITVGTTVNGTVEVDKTSAKAGETVTVTVTPMPGYELTNLSYKKNGMNIGIMGNSFAMPTGDVEIVATFKALPTYRIMMPSTFKGGTVTVDDTEAYAGQEVTVTVAANEGYELVFVSVMTAKGTQITLTDGKFTMPAEVVMIAAAFKEKASYVAQVGEQKFESLQAAIDAAEDGDEIVLLSDITLTADDTMVIDGSIIGVFVTDKNIALDMNGKTISVDLTGMTGTIIPFATVRDGHLTINDTVGSGKITATGAKAYALFSAYNPASKLTINGGAFELAEAADCLIHANANEAVVVNGGTFTLDNVGTGNNYQPWIFNVNGKNASHVIVNGGTYNSDVNHQFWGNEVMVPETLAVKDNGDGTWTVTEAEAYIVEIGTSQHSAERKIGYATLAAAIASVEKNAPETTIVLLKDVKVSGQYIGHSYAQKIVLDLNGKTLSSADRTLNVHRGGTEVLIKNGTVTGNTSAGTIQVSGGAKLTLENATIKSGSKAKAIKINKDGTLVINDASVKVQGGLDDLIVETGAQTLISAGTFNHDVSDYCVEEYGAVKNTDGTYTVKRVIFVENVTTGGKYETVAAAIAAIGKNAGVQELKLLGDVTVKGQFVGHSYAQQVVIDLNGFKMSSTDKALTVYRAGTEVTIKNGTVHGNSTGGTIQVTYGGKLTLGENVTITSGGSANALKVDSPATLIIDNDTVKVQGGKNDLIVADGAKVEISAGYFKHPVAEAWCAEGKMPNPVKTADGWYTVMDAGAAVINGKAYETLHDAFAAVKNGETIKVMKNIDLANEETVTLAEQYKTYFKVEGKSVTIDLNGKTISGTAGNADNMLVGVFSTENDGHLTITGEGTVDVQDGGKVYALIVNYEDGCSIVIENGTYKLDAASDSLIYCGAGYAEGTEGILVQDGTFHLGNLGKGPNGNGSPWIFNVYHKNQNHIMVNGGTFNADVNHQFWANEVFVPETLALKDNDNGTWTVVEAAGYVVEIGVSQHSRERKVGYVDLAAFEGEDVLGNKDGEYFVTGAGSLKQFAEEVGGEVKLENSNIAMTEDITVAENKELLMESDSKIAFNGGGNTITANGTGTKAGESYDYGYVGFIPANKEAATVENVTVTGSGFVEVGHHGTSMGGDYTINNLTVKDLIATLAINNGGNNIAAAFSHYGNAEMTDCVMTGTTTLKEGFKAYDAAFVNTTKTVMSGCTFGKIYLANQAHVTITNTVIDVIDSYAISTRNLGKLVIGAGAEIGVINLYDTGSYKATLVIEEGANVGAIVYNGVTYTAAEWMAR